MDNQKYRKSHQLLSAQKRIRSVKQEQENNGVGQRIRQLRTDLQLTGAELASLVGLRQSAISAIENNGRSIDCCELPLFAAALNTTVDYICSGHPPETVNITLETGLNENAIDTLKWYKSSGNNGFAALLNMLLYSANTEKGIPIESIGQELMQEMQDYIYHGNDYLYPISCGLDANGDQRTKKITVKQYSILRIQSLLDDLNRIYMNQRRNKKNETGKR